VKRIREGAILAVKGIGGFQLMVDARSEAAVGKLRTAKQRDEKPLAVMFPSLRSVREQCEVSALEARLLRSPQAPIVLLRNRGSALAPSVAPGTSNLGVMLPYSPLHHLLLTSLDFPVVATSGNLSGEPICIDETEALTQLADIASHFLVHNRRIACHADDSVTRVMAGSEQIQRRARGYAPMPLYPSHFRKQDRTLLAVGAHQKNVVAHATHEGVVLSQHVGDLDTEAAFSRFRSVIADFQRLHETRPVLIAADAHPDYVSTQFALATGAPIIRVQHHYAHVLSCMADNDVEAPLLGIAWDGAGYGTDGTIWGGEFLKITLDSFERFAHLRAFRLPGGDAAIKEPRRAALGLLYELFGNEVFEMHALAPVRAFSERELAMVKAMLTNRINAPETSSMGRLFDAVASLTGLRQATTYEGQAALALEFSPQGAATTEAYPLDSVGGVIDWEPMIRAIIADTLAGVSTGEISAKFHNGLVEAILLVARASGERRVALAGGCFQNRYLTECAMRRLEAAGFTPCCHHRVPPNDGGIALGQVVAAGRFQNSAMPVSNDDQAKG
jgi:hydrogenase maturation protein HypF